MTADMRLERTHATKGGAIAGIVGGLVLALFLAIGAHLQRSDLWTVFKGASFPLFHERALAPGFDVAPVIVGIVCHFAISIVWGILFGVVFYGLRRSTTAVAGIGYGLVVWLIMYYVVLPLVGAGRLARAAPMPQAVLEHILFGVSLAIAFLPFQRWKTPHGRYPRDLPHPFAP